MTKNPLCVAAVQFEMAENDKDANELKMVSFIKQAVKRKADIIVFPEMCLNGYHFLTQLSKEKLLSIAENAKTGPAVKFFEKQSKKYNITILFGLLERGKNEEMYNAYIVITPKKGVIFKHRKIHALKIPRSWQAAKLKHSKFTAGNAVFLSAMIITFQRTREF